MMDENYNNDKTPSGMRFVTSVSEQLLNEINAVSDKQVTTDAGEKVNVEYGYVVGTEANINAFKTQYNFNESYRLQYKGTNVNGVDTTVRERSANNFNYVKNVDCTSQVDGYGSNSRVRIDHKNFADYRLMTFVVNYTGQNAETDKGEDIVARAYIRYYDANGLLRTFYNDYGGTCVYGGCSANYNSVMSSVSGDIKTDVKQ